MTDLRYVWGGFVYLQDLLERAAVRLLSGTAPRAGFYLPQMPYRCHVGAAGTQRRGVPAAGARPRGRAGPGGRPR